MFEWPIRRAKWFLSFIFSGVACLPRKHLYPMGPKSYPTLAQKHLNGAVSWNKLYQRVTNRFFPSIYYFLLFFMTVELGHKEAVVLAKWLRTVTLAAAAANPANEHAG